MSRIVAGVVVLALLSTAVLAVRSAMQERRARAERSWRDARECLLARTFQARSDRTTGFRQCRGTVRRAAESSLELPEHSTTELELRASLDELVRALEDESEQQLASALERSSRAASALGWR